MVSKQRLTNAGVLAVALALITTSAYIAFGSAQTTGTTNTTTQNTLAVSGTGIVTIAPDQAQITLGAITQGATAQQAAMANSKIIDAVLGQFGSMGISSQNIASVSYSIWPTYNYSKSGNQQTVTAYQAQHQIQVTVTDSNLTKLSSTIGRIIDMATSVGANQLYGIQFSAAPQTAKDMSGKALRLATQDASSKAQIMAGALGVNIVGVQSATESSPYYPPIYYAAGAEKATSIQPGTFSLTASVQVTYIIQ